MKLKLVIHRLRPVIAFEHSQLSLPRAELNAPLTAAPTQAGPGIVWHGQV